MPTHLFLLLLLIPFITSKSLGIIGAGMGGASSAYHASLHLPHSLTIYEKEKIGGRVATIEIDGMNIEYGGSVYHSANYLFRELSEKFELQNVSAGGEMNGQLGIFDGKDFLFVESQWKVLTMVKFLWRYGLAVFRVNWVAQPVVDRWVSQYKDGRVWESVQEFVEMYGYQDIVKESVRDILVERHGVQERFVDELIAGVSRVTYNQNSSDINGMGGLISVVGTGEDLFVLKEGNFRLAEELIKASKAEVKMTEVTKIEKIEENGEIKYLVSSKNSDTKDKFDILIIASPIENNNIEFDFELPETARNVREYRRVHVTFVKGVFDPSYFGVDTTDDIPTDVLTSLHSTSPFTSIGTKKIYENGSRLVKFFSVNKLTEQDLNKIYTSREETIRLEWDAYPFLKPNPIYPPIILDQNLYYVNAFESLVSVMEGELTNGRNIIRLITKASPTPPTETTQKPDL